MADVDPELLEHIAGAYVLGTLTSRERERCKQLMQVHPDLGLLVGAWENRLLPLITGIPPVSPSAHVWQAIEARIDPVTPAAPYKPVRVSFGFLPGALSLIFGTALGAAVVVWGKHSETLPESYVGFLSADIDTRPIMHTSVLRKEATLFVKLLEPIEVESNQMLVLWAIQKNVPPRRIGVVQPIGSSRIALQAPADTIFQNVETLAISSERADAATTGAPSGEYLLKGPFEKLW